MLVDDCLDFTGINIFSARNNHVFQAVQDEEITGSVLVTDISCAKHTVAKCERGFFLIVSNSLASRLRPEPPTRRAGRFRSACLIRPLPARPLPGKDGRKMITGPQCVP